MGKLKTNEKGQFVTKNAEEHLDDVYPCPITGCFWWSGFIRPDGYGVISVNKKTTFAHRAFYEYFNNTTLAPRQPVFHTCGNRSCVNPDHLTTELSKKIYVRDVSIEEDGRQIYYLYRHLRKDTGQPFYVGIGKLYDADKDTASSRTYYRRAYAGSKARTNPHWHNIVNKVGGFEVEIMLDCLTKTEACAKEKEFVALYGRSSTRDNGLLCNLTDGGDGTKGWVCTPEISRKFSESRKGRKPSQESIMRGALTRTGRKRDESTKLKIRQSKLKLSRKVVCVETGQIFDFLKDAASEMFNNPKLSSNIRLVCLGKRPKAGGYTFRWHGEE